MPDTNHDNEIPLSLLPLAYLVGGFLVCLAIIIFLGSKHEDQYDVLKIDCESRGGVLISTKTDCFCLRKDSLLTLKPNGT